MPAPDLPKPANGTSNHVRSTKIKSRDGDGVDDLRVESVALTSLPSLTGLRPTACREVFVVKTYDSELAFYHLQETARRHHAVPATIFQAAWASILATYTGITDDITFLTIPPHVGRECQPYESPYQLCRYNARSQACLPIDHLLRHFGKPDSNDGTSGDTVSTGDGPAKISQADGTVLDLRGLSGYAKECSAKKEGSLRSTTSQPAVLIKIFVRHGGTLSFEASGSDTTISRETAGVLLTQLDQTLRAIISKPVTSISRLSESFASKCLSVSNPEPGKDTSFAPLHCQFEEFAISNPSCNALEFHVDIQSTSPTSTCWTYESLNKKANTFATHLQTCFGSLDDCIVPLCLERCPELYIAILGILKVGAAWCPIDPSFPARRRHDLVLRSGGKALVLNAQSPKDGLPEDVHPIDMSQIDWSATEVPRKPNIDPDDIAYLIWTSGTTGAPKGVPIHHGAAVASMRALQASIPSDVRSGNVRCLQFSQFTFDVFVQDLFYTWGIGGTLISADRTTMLGSFAELTAKAKATHAHLTPAFAASVARKKCPTLEVVTMIGEKLTTTVADDWSEDCRLYNTYGPAETTVVSTLRLVPPKDIFQSANVGHPLPSVSAFVMHDEELVMRNGIGELALGGPQLSKGYWNDPAKSRERFVWNERLKTTLYMTGDIVRQLYDGSFEFVGRTDDLVKIQGIRIELSEIAFALRSCHSKVEQVDVHFLDRPDRPSKVIVAFLATPGLEARIGGVITDEAGIEIARSAIIEAKTQLPSYMIPKIFIVVPNIPRTSSAKVDRTVIKRLYAEMDLAAWERKLGSEGHLDEQADDLSTDEIAVIEIVAKLTGTSKGAISRHSTLPSIGVDSITATRLATRLHAQDIHISIADILQSVTVGDLLGRLFGVHTVSSVKAYDIRMFHKEAVRLLDAQSAARLELVMPALPLQESLLSESLRNPMSYWSHIFFVLASGTDITTLENAWNTVAKCNDALRTAFLPVVELSGGLDTKATFLQLIHKEATCSYTVSRSTYMNFRTHAKYQAEKIAERMQENKFAEPPWAVSVIVLESRRIMMLSLHHSIRDEPSLNHIMHDLQQAYYNNNMREPLRQRHQLREATSVTYADSDRSEQDEKFWARSLSDFVDDEDSKSWPELKLTEQTTGDGTITYISPEEKPYKDLQVQATNIGATSVASLLRIVWGFVLLEYLETDRIVFGETWSARGEASALEDVIGPLVSVVPVPFQAHGTLRQITQSQAAFQSRSKPHYSIHPRIIRKILRKPENEPLYPAVFNFIPDLDEQASCENNGLWRRMDDVIGLSVEHAIALNVSLTSESKIKIELTANRKNMDYAHLEILAKQIYALIDLTLHQPQADLTQIRKSLDTGLLSVTPSCKENESNPVWTQNPTAWVDRNASLHSDWPAAEVVTSFGYDSMVTKTWSYEQLRRAYQNVADLIQSAGFTKRSIAVCVERSLDVYAVILAIMSTGNIYLPIAEDLPLDRKLFLLTDSDAAMLFTNKSLSESFSNISQSCHLVLVENINFLRDTNIRQHIASQPTDNAYLLYTSGSTGTPKGVLVSRGNLMSFIEAISNFISSHVDMPALQGQGKWLGMASYAFDVHLLEMFFAWRHGMSTVTAPRSMLLDSLELALQKLKVTHASFVPSLVDNTGLDPANLPDLRYMSLGGEKITKKAIDTWSGSHVALANAYGPTEVTIGCCFQRVRPHTNVRNVGFPLSYTVAHVLRFESEEYTLRGTSGELCLTGDLVANGYHKRPDAKGFVQDFRGRRMYRTGDRVRLMADGSFEFLGRNDDQTKIRGQRIELGEVSEAVRAGAAKVMHTNIVEAATIVVQHPTLARPQLVAFVAAQGNGRRINGTSPEIIRFPNSGTAKEIRNFCSDTLPAFMVPDHIIRLTLLPLVSISRKVDNKNLKTLFTGTSFADLTSQSPEKPRHSRHRPLSEAEKAIRSVAAEVLAVDQGSIDANTNLFRLGLDSLNIISLTIKLQKIGFMSTLSKVMNKPSVEQIANLPRNVHGSAGSTTASSTRTLEQRFHARGDNDSEQSNMATIRPCLPLQETLVASSLNHEGEALYVNHVILEISPDVDLTELVQAWTTMAEDHEILRTCFREFDNRYVQVVLKSSPLTFERINTSSADSRVSYLHQRAPKIASEIIDRIESEPPIRLTMAASHSSQQESLLMVSIHHSLYDAESFSMLLDEVHARYEKHTESIDHTPVTALIDYIASQSPQDATVFWAKYLGGYRSCLLPNRSADDSSESISRQFVTPLSKLESLAASLNGTPASLVQALFGVVLAENLGANDVVFGTILSGRTVPVENAHTILAPCITTIPHRVQLRSDSKSSNIVDVITTAQRGFVESIEYQHTALRDIHRWVQAEKPLFDTLFSYTRAKKAAPWSHLWREIECSMPNEFPLAMEINADQFTDHISARVDFTTAFGTAEEASSLLDRLEQLMRSLSLGENVALRLAMHHKNGALKESIKSEWTKLEVHIRDKIAEIVELSAVEITKDASFFALGVDSIIAIQLAKRLRQHGIQCSSADIMRHASINQLAQRIESQQDNFATKASDEKDLDSYESKKGQDKSDRPTTYHCTPLQSSMLTQTLGADESLYVHHHAICLAADFDVSKMNKAWADLVATTEILRTSFHFSEQTGLWSGIANKPSSIVLHEHDPNSKLEQVLPRIKEGLVFCEAADFAKPPWAINIVGRVYILSLHHSLYDGESLNRLFGDLASLLKGERIRRSPSFSVAARAIHDRTVEAEEYWARKLAGFRGNSASSSRHQFRELRGTLKLDYWEVLESCRALGVTMQSASLLAYGKTLAHLSQRQDVVYGHVIRGRTVMQDADEVVGPLFNTSPIRVNLDRANISNGDAARTLQYETGESQDFQHASLSRIQQAWREKIEDPEAELLDALFVFRKSEASEEDWPWTSIEIDDDAAPTEYSTNLEIEQRLDKITFCVNSSTVEDLDKFMGIFEKLLRDILEHPEDSATASLGDTANIEANATNRYSVPHPEELIGLDVTNDQVDAVRKLLAKVSGISEANITNEASIFALGLDSISAIQIAQVGRKDGLNITVADVLQGRTVIGISQRLKQKTSSEVEPENKPNEHVESESKSSYPSDIQQATRSEVLKSAGLRDDDVQDVLPCLPGQVYHLTTWLQSGRTLGEGTFTYTCNQALDPNRLLEAWRALRERHAILRTVFAATGAAKAVQIVLKPSAVRSDAFNCIILPEVNGNGITRIVKQEACHRFDFFTPPVRLVLVKGRHGNYLLLRLHHALYDAWSIPILLDDLINLYQNPNLEKIEISFHALSILEITRSATTPTAQQYWRKSLEHHQPTILRSHVNPDQAASEATFHLHKTTIENLHFLEETCQSHGISLPKLILLAVARVLARHTALLNPVFGFLQGGRSAVSSSERSPSTIPYLNVTPLLVRNAGSVEEVEVEGAQIVKQRVEDIQEDLAARVPFEQSYLSDVLEWVGANGEGGKMGFNTFVNILWEKPDHHSHASTTNQQLLTPWTPTNSAIEDIPPSYRLPGKTAVDSLDTSMLEVGNLFLEIQRDERGDCVKLFGRCDEGVRSREEAEGFLGDVCGEVGRLVEVLGE